MAESIAESAPIARPFVVGLTGGIGCGKSTVARLFAELGAAIVDTDEIAHLLTRPGGPAIPAIRAAFGEDFVGADGAMDRARMREHVFADDTARRKLEAIVHPLIRGETRRRVVEAAAHAPYVIAMVPLLFEGGRWQEYADRTLVVDCAEQEQIERVGRRSGLDEAQVRAIMAKQISRAERISLADDVVDNSGDLVKTSTMLAARVEALHRKYLALAGALSNSAAYPAEAPPAP